MTANFDQDTLPDTTSENNLIKYRCKIYLGFAWVQNHSDFDMWRKVFLNLIEKGFSLDSPITSITYIFIYTLDSRY